MVLIRIFEFWKKSQAVNQFSKSIRSRNLGIMYRKLTRSTSVFRFTFRYKWRGFAIIDISYFSQRYRKFKRKNVPTYTPAPNAVRVAKHSRLTSLCVGLLCAVSVLSVRTLWVCYEQCINLLVSVRVYWTFTYSALRHHSSYKTLYQFFSYYTKKHDIFSTQDDHIHIN